MTDSGFACYTFIGFYERKLCYTISSNKTECSIVIDGATCNSCEMVRCDSTSSYEGDTPFAWDCTNAPGGTQGSNCNEGEFILPVFDRDNNCPVINSTNPNVTTAAPTASAAPSPLVNNAPVVAPAAPPSTSGSGCYDYYGTGSSVWRVVWTSLVAGMAIALGTTGAS